MTEKESVEVVIDSREPEKIIPVVNAHEDVSGWIVDERDEGDLIINEKICIERKTPSDYCSSLMEGRLKLQAEKLMNSDYQGFVLIEGNMDDFENLQHTSIHINAIRGSMASLTVRYGVPTIPIGNLENLIDFAVRMGRKSVEEESSPVMETGAVDSKDAPTIVKIYSCIPNIGPESAWNLYAKYPSLEGILGASEEELAEIPTIGSTRAESVLKALREDSEETGGKVWTQK